MAVVRPIRRDRSSVVDATLTLRRTREGAAKGLLAAGPTTSRVRPGSLPLDEDV